MNSVGLIAKKIGMTAIFSHKGQRIPCTVVEAGPCQIVQKKEPSRDGYSALQLGFAPTSARKLSKPVRGHYWSHVDSCFRYLKEFQKCYLKPWHQGCLSSRLKSEAYLMYWCMSKILC